jgi:Fur family ferric uptake transcriptional regulator
VAKIKILGIFCNENLFLSTFCIYFLIFSLTNENRCDRIVPVLIFKPKFEKSRSEENTVEKTTYHTAGRENLLHYLADRPNQRLTVEELTAALEREGVTVGKSTVYRLAGRLCDEGKLKRERDAARNCYVYTYAEDTHSCDGRHFHLKCLDCGRLFHLECRHSEALCEHIEGTHHFRIDSGKTMLYGQCESCRRAAESR